MQIGNVIFHTPWRLCKAKACQNLAWGSLFNAEGQWAQNAINKKGPCGPFDGARGVLS